LPSVVRRTAALPLLLLLAPSALLAQGADTLPRIPVGFAREMPRLTEPPALRSPWLGWRPAVMASYDSAVSAALDSSRLTRARAIRQSAIYGVADQPAVDTAPVRRPVLGGLEKYADLSLDGQARLDVRTERVNNERCTAADANIPDAGCGGGIRAPRLENQLSVRSGGTIGRRVHVNVDYDANRDFSANNNIQVYYEGLTDEVVQRIEVGTVTFRPPQSRFLTAAVPRTNFGVNGVFELGPMQFQALVATQKGSAVSERVFNIGSGETSQPQDRIVRDLDFESGRFFWAVDPQRIPGYPAIDILTVDPQAIPAGERPADIRVYRYRTPTVGGVNPNLGGIRAFASNDASPLLLQRLGQPEVDEGVEWTLLQQGRDYYLDPSGLWFVLASKIDPKDYLAVSYVTATGTTVGTFPAADRPAAIDSLVLILEPQRGPEAGSFRHEMRNVYRVAGSDLQTATLDVSISLNRSERPASGLSTYLAQLGLAIPTDESVIDRQNRLFPRTRDPGAGEIVRESYIIFPHLRPFADAQRLSAAELSDSLYQTPYYLLFSQGPPARFQFRLRYEAVGGTDRSTLSLNALQIKEGSEQLTSAGRLLQRGVDYAIDYSTGQVTFNDPEALFGDRPAQVTARFEQQDLFAVAPTTILGLTSRYSLGELGSVNLLGVFQREATAYNRPQLGFEAKANLVGGITTDLHFQSRGITRLLDRLTSAPATAPSRLDLNAELAMSRPDPNRSGAAYLEEFEVDVGTPLSLSELVWEFGSLPQRTDGLDPLLGFGAGFDAADAVALTWQNLVPAAGGVPFRMRPQDIDTTIVTAGRGDQFETGLFIAFHADTAGGLVQNDRTSLWSQPARPFRPRWRSMVTPLSSTGVDLSRSEYLEFYVFQPGAHSADSAGVQLMIDLGTVNEDALAIAPDTLAIVGEDSVFTGRQYVGLGRLDTERGSDGIFNADEDDIGILGDRPDSLSFEGEITIRDPALCTRELTGSVQVFPWGDLSGRCTNGNGQLDSEDLNRDLLLNARGPNEDVFRYVVDLRGDTYKVPNRGVKSIDGSGREAGWTLYRVPIRDATAILGVPELRLIQHLRITVLAPPDAGGDDVVARFAFARMRFVGAPWVRRSETPIAGLSGSTGGPHGEVLTAVVSTENVELGYTSPPGARNAVNDRNAGQGSLGSQINEKSLRIIARELAVGDRAEAYLRFPAGPQNLLNYRELRVWARGHGEGWERGDLQAFVKLGSDDRNFYLFRAPANTASWEPEMVVDLDAWRRLRGELETRWLRGDPPSGSAECGGDAAAYVICEGQYLVHLADPGVNPPNLAAVQELAAGLLRVADLGALPEAEVWIDDIRLTQPVSQVGKAIALDARLTASDVGDLSLSFHRQDGQFRQIGETPSYRTNNTVRLSGIWRLDRFLPAGLGLSIPLGISLARTGVDPQLLTGTDILGASLEGLRRPKSWSTAYTVSIRRNRKGANWLTRGLLDPLSLTGVFARGSSQTELSKGATNTMNVASAYNLVLRRTGPVFDLTGIVPGFLRNTEAGKALAKSQVSLVPSTIRLSSGITRDEGEFNSFQVPIFRQADEALVPSRSLNHVWRNVAGTSWQPLGMLQLGADLTSTRDLRRYSDSTALGRLAGRSRRAFLGMDVGVERDRQFGTNFAVTPRLTSWLRPRFNSRSNFVLSRSLTSRPPIREIGDTMGAFILPQTLNNNRSTELGASLDLTRLVRGIAGDSGRIATIFGRMRPVDLSRRLTRNSTFDLAAFDPAFGYQLGLGGRGDFLEHQGVPAVGVSESHVKSVSSGADFPMGISFTLTYSETDALRFQRVSDAFRETRTITRDWPNGTARWTHTFRSGPLALVGLGTAFRSRSGITEQPTAAGTTVSGVSSTSFGPDLQLSMRNGLRMSLQYATSGTTQRNAASTTLADDKQLYGQMSYSFKMPEWMARSRKRIRTTLSGRSSHSVSCLRAPEETECANTVSETLNQELTARLETDLAQLFQGGLDFGYTLSEAKHLNRRISTLFLTVGFQIVLSAGEFR
jgi:hypothetical protein